MSNTIKLLSLGANLMGQNTKNTLSAQRNENKAKELHLKEMELMNNAELQRLKIAKELANIQLKQLEFYRSQIDDKDLYDYVRNGLNETIAKLKDILK